MNVMTKWRAAVAAGAFYCAMPAPSHALTGNELLQQCREEGTVSERSRCIGYLDGYTDGALHEWMTAVIESVDAKARVPPYAEANSFTVRASHCLPDGVTFGQLRQVVLKFLRENPAETHKSAAVLTARALWRAFPCPRP